VLIDHCPACRSPFWWRDLVAVSHCPNEDCLLPLDRLAPTYLPDPEREQLEPLGDPLGPDEAARERLRGSLPGEFHGWPEADILDTVEWLATLENRLAGRPSTALGCVDRVGGLRRLQAWPGSVDGLLDDHWAGRVREGRLGRLRASAETEAALRDLHSIRGRAFVAETVREVRG
jgi:hypothetical protein